MNSRLTHGVSVVSLLLVVGCGDSKSEHTGVVPVTGLVTHQDQPVADATVMFQPREQGKQAAAGRTDAEGRFQLQTFEHNDGALPGEYLVSVSKVEITAPEFEEDDPRYVPPPPPKFLVPEKYGRPTTSGLTATVTNGAKNEFAFELKD